MTSAHQWGQALGGSDLQAAVQAAFADDPVELHRGRDTFNGVQAEIPAIEQPGKELVGGRADDDSVGLSESLETRRKGGGLAERKLFPFPSSPTSPTTTRPV